jgi:polyisoprenyl-phosphate glycosyltransferase
MDLSVVIPVYGSQETLAPLTKRLSAVLTGLGRPWEIVFVDDSSPDRAWAVLQELQAMDPEHIVLVQLTRNFGQHNALMCAFRHARGEFIVTLDDDGQNPPEEIPRLLETIKSQHLDLVYGTIATKKYHSPLQNAASWLITKFGQLVFHTRVAGSSYRILRRELMQSILTYDLNFTYIDGLLMWCTQRVGAIPVAHAPRSAGRSHYSFRKRFTKAFDMFTNFSLLPLRLVSLLGFAFAAVGSLLGCYYVILYLLGNIGTPGYASIIVAILIMGGVQMLALGVMGEYLGRIHLNINRKPQFVVRQTLPARGPASPAESNPAP